MKHVFLPGQMYSRIAQRLWIILEVRNDSIRFMHGDAGGQIDTFVSAIDDVRTSMLKGWWIYHGDI